MPRMKFNACVGRFAAPLETDAMETWCRQRTTDAASAPAFALLFLSPSLIDHARDLLEIVRIYGQVGVVAGCTSTELIADGSENEEEAGAVLALYYLPETRARAIHLDPAETDDRAEAARSVQNALGDAAENANGYLLFATPDSVARREWLPAWDDATRGRPTVGGLASFDPRDPEDTWLFHNGEIVSEGAVALALEGRVGIHPVVAQGCRPIGTPWVVTEADDNVIHQLGNRPVLEVLRDTLEEMSEREKALARGNVFVGLVRDEYKDAFGVGDFLVRNLAGIDPQSGALAIATPLRAGQNLQFQIRDAETAADTLAEALHSAQRELADRAVHGAFLCECVGRGSSLYGVPDHDTSLIRDTFTGLPVAGFAGNGEFGPLAGHTELHGYTASMALFVDTEPATDA